MEVYLETVNFQKLCLPNKRPSFCQFTFSLALPPFFTALKILWPVKLHSIKVSSLYMPILLYDQISLQLKVRFFRQEFKISDEHNGRGCVRGGYCVCQVHQVFMFDNL